MKSLAYAQDHMKSFHSTFLFQAPEDIVGKSLRLLYKPCKYSHVYLLHLILCSLRKSLASYVLLYLKENTRLVGRNVGPKE